MRAHDLDMIITSNIIVESKVNEQTQNELE